MFKAGDIVICIDPCNNIVMDGVYEIEKIHTGADEVIHLYTTCRLKNVDGAYWLTRFKLANEQPELPPEIPEQAKPATTESSPQGKTTIEVGSPIVVNYVKGQYNVVNYKTTVLKIAESFGGSLYTFKAPGLEHGNPVPSEIWSLTAPYVVLDTENKPFAVGDKVFIVKEWQPFSGNDPTVGQVGIVRTVATDGRARIHTPTVGCTFWYEPGDFVHYTEGMAVPKEAKPRKIINPRKVS